MGLIGQETGSKYTSYHFDLRGSTVALTNSTGQVTERFQYSPYGVLLSGDVEKTPFLFNGMYGVMSDSNGLYYMRARFYSPEMRRFVNQDILLGNIEEGQTLNRYAYVTGRPVSFVDPFGLGACYVFFPNFPITYAPGRTSTWLGGHAGVLGYDDESGVTQYYQYGRYSPNSKGIVGKRLPAKKGNIQRITVPNLKFGADGYVTPESLERLREALSYRAGQRTETKLVCFFFLDEEKVYSYINSIANDPERRTYSWFPWPFSNHCRSFAKDALWWGGLLGF